MSQHTPGPWHLCGASRNDRPCFCGIVWESEGEKRSVVYLEHDRANEGPHVERGSDEWYANARLIAAAPELYDALRLLVRKAPRRRNVGGDEFVGTEAVFDVAEQLLARIDGEGATS